MQIRSPVKSLAFAANFVFAHIEFQIEIRNLLISNEKDELGTFVLHGNL